MSRWYYDSYRPDFETEQRDDSSKCFKYIVTSKRSWSLILNKVHQKLHLVIKPWTFFLNFIISADQWCNLRCNLKSFFSQCLLTRHNLNASGKIPVKFAAILFSYFAYIYTSLCVILDESTCHCFMVFFSSTFTYIFVCKGPHFDGRACWWISFPSCLGFHVDKGNIPNCSYYVLLKIHIIKCLSKNEYKMLCL